MERVEFSLVLWDTLAQIFWILAAVASIRSALALIGWQVEKVGWVKSKALSRVTRTELEIVSLLILLISVAAEIYHLTVRQGIYWADDVERDRKIATKPRREPEGHVVFTAIPYAGEPEWIADHRYWLEQEGDRDKAGKFISSYVVAKAEYISPFATRPFELVLRAVEGYTIVSRAAFRIHGVGSPLESFQRLRITSGRDFRDIKVSVPESEELDTIVIIVRVSSTTGQVSIDLRDIITSKLE